MRPTPRPLAFALFALVFSLARAHEPVADMLDAAQKFLGSLDATQKAKALYALDAKERETWFFVPIARQGLPLKQLSPAQRDLALGLLRSGLSQRGYARAEAIMSFENVLKELEHDRPAGRRDPLLYYVTVFGEPAAGASWGWRVEGHHLSFNFTIVGGSHVLFAPEFVGSNPGEIREGPRQGESPLRDEDELGRAFVKSLDPAQRKIAIFAAKSPNEILTGNRARVDPLAPAGLPFAQLTAAQQEKFRALLELFITRNRAELADQTRAELAAAGFDTICFGWAGGFEPGEGHYYRLQGPTFVVEFDNTQNHANHIHTVWRDFKNDFGHDLLAQHYAQEHAR
jgi:hypothetical protein